MHMQAGLTLLVSRELDDAREDRGLPTYLGLHPRSMGSRCFPSPPQERLPFLLPVFKDFPFIYLCLCHSKATITHHAKYGKRGEMQVYTARVHWSIVVQQSSQVIINTR
jgi:hypothetical protein